MMRENKKILEINYRNNIINYILVELKYFDMFLLLHCQYAWQ